MKIQKLFFWLLAAASAALSAVPAWSGALTDLQAGTELPEITVPRAPVPAAVAELRPVQKLSLSDFKGYTYMQFMAAPNGVKSAFDKDAKAPFAFVSGAAVKKAAETFDPAVYAKVAKSVTGGEAGLMKLADKLAGAQATPVTAAGAIAEDLKELALAPADRIGLTAVVAAPLLSLASGAGVPVILDQNNYFLNIGYKSGAVAAEVEKDVKSGRSFGASPAHKALDVSDKYYLQEMHDYLSTASNPAGFFRTMMDVLTSCDASGLAALPPAAQGVLTDFTGVYTAELDRYAMTGFKTHAWQNDLAEATLVSAYSSTAKRVVVDGQLVEGDPLSFFGVGTNGSGIGIRRKDRRMLQTAVMDAERQLHPELVAAVETLVGRKGGDLIHNLMTYLNAPAGQAQVQANAGQLAKAVVDLAVQVRADSPAITKAILAHGLPQQTPADAHNEAAGHENP